MNSRVVVTVGRAPGVLSAARYAFAVGASPADMPGTSTATSTKASAESPLTPIRAGRQPHVDPRNEASGTPSTAAAVIPPKTVASARLRRSGPTMDAPAAEDAGPKIAAPTALTTRVSAIVV